MQTSGTDDDGYNVYALFGVVPRGQVACVPCNTSSLVLPDSVVALAMPCFSGCAVKNVSIPDSVTYIGAIAFYSAVSLEHVFLSDSVTYIGQSAFGSCSALQELTLPDSLVSISFSSFSSCASLETVMTHHSCPDAVTYIGYAAFGDCTGLTTVTMGGAVTTIGTKAFFGCTLLSTIIFSNSLAVKQPFAFQYCSSLVEVNIPTSVTSIGAGTFYGCNICSSGSQVFDDDDNDVVGPSVYRYAMEQMHLDITDVRAVMPYTVYHCNQLVSITIADTVAVIHSQGIPFPPFLDNVIIPDSVDAIESAAFQGCSTLKTIQIPPTANVSNGAFFGCGCQQHLYTSGAMLDECIPGYLNSTSEWVAFTMCSTKQYESLPGCYTADRQCSTLLQCDPSTEFESMSPTSTTNRGCEQKLSSWKKISIGVGVFVVALGVVLGAAYLYKKRKRTEEDLHLKELLLNDERTAKQSLYAENIEMKRAWEIHEDDLRMGVAIASGAFGNVFRAKWGHIDVAVKMLKQSISEETLEDEEFNREVSFMQRIRHPNLLIFYCAGVTATNSPFLVVEWMRNGSLRAVLLSPRELVGVLRLRMALDVARGMRRLHSLGSIHRDLKSDNCLVGGTMRVKVGDFGESKLLGSGTTPGSAFNHSSPASGLHTSHVGTPLWMAPGLMIKGRYYGQEIDVYSFAIVMWELLTRATPWETDLIVKSEAAFVLALYDAVRQGRRPSVPATSDLPQSYTVLMTRCWSNTAPERPPFTDISAKLEELYHFQQDRVGETTAAGSASLLESSARQYDFAQ